MVSPQFLLRVGGLPIDVVDALRFDNTFRHIDSLLSIEHLLAGRRDALVDALYEAVNQQKEQQAARRKLINLKRDVFNLQPLDAFEEKRAFALTLASPARELLLEWVDLWERHRRLREEGPTLFAQELAHKRALLKQVIDTPDFRKGIALASPVLDSATGAYLASDNLRLNRNARTAERSLFEYLLRTACKTSPFSTFTAVGPGTFESSAEQPSMLYQAGDMQKRSFTRLNVSILSKLSALIVACESLRKDLPVRLTPAWHIIDNHIRYLRRVSLEKVDDDAPVALDTVHEDVFYLPVGRLLAALLELLGDGRRARIGEISAQLQVIPEFAGEREEINAYLEHLLRLGLLIVPDLQQDLHSDAPVASYCRGLRALAMPATDALAAQLEEIERLVERFSDADAGERRTLMEEIRQRVQRCFEALGDTSGTLPRTLVYEDTTLHFPRMVANTARWREALAHAAEFQQVLPALDINLERKVVTRGYFRARYGVGQRCDDFLDFAYEFRQSFFEQYLQGSRMAMGNLGKSRPMNHFNQPELELLFDTGQAVADYMRQAYAKLPAGNAELVLDEDFVQSLLPYLPTNATNLASHTFFSQLAAIDGVPSIIVNRVYTGFTLIFSRFAHYFNESEGQRLVPVLRETLERISPPGAVFAELKGGYEATNLNLHPQVTAYELVCPGDISQRPLEEQIPLDDLFILDDEDEGRLRLYSKRLGKEVIPLYLGFLLPMALPEMQQVLLNFSYASMCLLDLWKGVEVGVSKQTVTAYPRLRYKNLVLQRAQWKVAAAFPRRASGESDFDFLLQVNRWRREQGIPVRVFVAPERFPSDTSAPAPQAAEGGDLGAQMRSYKPLYLDFENHFSVSLLEALARDTARPLVFTEMLPDREQLWLQHEGQAYVTEFILEMNSVEGDRHE